MIDIVYTISKYLILFFFVIFTIISFRAQRDVPDELKLTTFRTQKIILISIHAVSFFVICLHSINGDTELNLWKILGFYGAQLVYFLFMTAVVPRMIRLNSGLNNVMCMFLCIGFIVQTRLNFDNSVKQFIIVAAGTVIFMIFCIFCKRARFMRNLTWIYCFSSLGLLILVLVLSTVSRGAKLSLEIGNLFSFQPLEFVKILFVLFIAGAFYKSTSLKYVLITAVLAAVHILIQVFCKDLGSAFILFIIYLMMLYIATHRFAFVVLGTAAFSAACVLAYKMFDHVQIRVSAWLDPWSDINNTGYQIAQSLFAIGTGGWFGSGLYNGSPNTIPIVSKDMVISAISEEFGVIFAIFLILLCLCFALMIFRVAIRIELLFYKLLAFGLGVSYAIQVFLTIGGAFKFIPLTGVTLPFISSGGSSIIASMVMIGIVQALYVISESDVAHERKMVAAGADISEFSGYENLAPEEDNYEDEYFDDRYHVDDSERRGSHYRYYEDNDEYRDDDSYLEDEYPYKGKYTEEDSYNEGDYYPGDSYNEDSFSDDYSNDNKRIRRYSGLQFNDRGRNQFSGGDYYDSDNEGYPEEYLSSRRNRNRRTIKHIDSDEI